MEKSTKKSQENRINEFTISYLFKRLPLELIENIMHCLPFEHSKALSEGFQGTLSLNPYRFHEPDDGAKVLMESLIKSQDITALDGLLANKMHHFCFATKNNALATATEKADTPTIKLGDAVHPRGRP